MAAIFPAAVATPLQLLTALNNTKVTLNVNAGIGDTTLTVDDASPLPASGFVTFADNDANPETISYTGKSGNNLTGLSRGADGTAAAAHVVGAAMEMRWNAAYHNTLATELIAVEQNISDRFGTGTNILVPGTRMFTLAATTNQIVLGVTNTITISAPAPAASRVYTIPDAGAAASFVMTQGTQTIAGAITFSSAPTFSTAITVGGALTVTPTTNQLILGVTRTVTINAVQPATASRTWTVPDVGSDATFAALGGTQTFSGAKTFSGGVTLSTVGLAMGGQKITGAALASASGDVVPYDQVFNLWAYRRPVLQYVSGTTVQIEAGIDGTASEVTILFPDGTVRKDSTTLHTLLTISRVAALSGTKQSGMFSGAVAANTWYSIYAVKATDNTTDFVAVAIALEHKQANFATLNSDFGTNGWVYLGLIRCGDGSGASTAISKFVQHGNTTIFENFVAGTASANTYLGGILLVTSAGATTITYTYAAGTGPGQIPSNVLIGIFGYGAVAGTGVTALTDAVATRIIFLVSGTARSAGQIISTVTDGLALANSSSIGMDIYLHGYIDGALGVGSNPLL